MWAAHGALAFAAGDDPQAVGLRDRFTLLFIPSLDPDAAASGVHDGMICSFVTRFHTPESIAYASWFKSWVDAGKRIDVVFDLHNVQSAEMQHVSCPMAEGVGERGRVSMLLLSQVVASMQQNQFMINPRPSMRGWSPDRLGGWLSLNYGPLTLAYEVNSQASTRHLTLHGLQDIGATFLKAIDEAMEQERTRGTLLAVVDARRTQRLANWKTHGDIRADLNAIEAEAAVLEQASLSGDDPTNLMVETRTP